MGWETHANKYRSVSAAAAAILALATLATPASALTTTGVAVGAVGLSAQVGLAPVFNATLGGNAIPFFITLGNTSGTYGTGGSCSGNGFGTCADSGDGGGILTMIFRFSPSTRPSPTP